MYDGSVVGSRAVGGRPRRARVAPLAGPLTYTKAAYNELHGLIQSLELAPGERLVESELSERFGFSKTPIREALHALEKDRLVEIAPHIGATVTWLSLADYEQQLFILDALELPALELVAGRASSEDFGRWDAAMAMIIEAFNAGDRTLYRTCIAKLHRAIFAAAGYPRLTELVEAVQQALYRYGVLFIDPLRNERAQELRTVRMRLQLIKNRDPAGAATLVRQQHASLLETARTQVARRKPSVMRHLREGR